MTEVSNEGVLVLDLEASGLFHDWENENSEVTDRIHCFCATDHAKNLFVHVAQEDFLEVRSFIARFEQHKPGYKIHLMDFNDIAVTLSKYEAVACHNLLGYDAAMLSKFFGIEFDVIAGTLNGKPTEIMDTLIMSRWIWPDRPLPKDMSPSYKCPVTGRKKLHGPHGLNAWAYRTGTSKPVVEDWRDQPIDVYVMRCIDDVINNLATFDHLLKELGRWYKLQSTPNNWRSLLEAANPMLKVEHMFADIIFKQVQEGALFDQDLARQHLETLDKMIVDIENKVNPTLPLTTIGKTEAKIEYTIPSTLILKDGWTVSKYGAKFLKRHWCKLWYDENKQLMIEGYGNKFKVGEKGNIITDKKQLTIDNNAGVKDYLTSKGWVPEYWNYAKTPDGKFKLDKDKQRIKTSSKIKESGNICPNLMEMEDEFAKDYVRYMTLLHRRRSIESFDEDSDGGWLNHPRLQVDGRLPTYMNTIKAPSKRCAHQVVANLPKPKENVIFGKELRDLFIAPEDYLIVGADLSGLEDRCRGHFCHEFDNGATSELLLHGDSHQVVADAFSKRFDMEVTRDTGKNLNFACLPKEGTEVLTSDGWKRFEDLTINQEILSYDTHTKTITKDRIKHIHDNGLQDVHIFDRSTFKVECTPNHRWVVEQPYRTKKHPKRVYTEKFVEFKDFTQEHRIRVAAPYDNKDINHNILPGDCELLGWVLSDGSYKFSDHTRNKEMMVTAQIFQSRNNGYIEKIYEMFDKYQVPFKEYTTPKGVTHFNINPQYFRDLLRRHNLPIGGNKHDVEWTNWVMTLSQQDLKAFVDAFWWGDGNVKTYLKAKQGKLINQNEGTVLDAVELALFLTGNKTSKILKSKAGEKLGNARGNKDCYSVNWKEGRNTVTTARAISYSVGKKDTFCITTNNSTFIIRQHGSVTITGNCIFGAGGPKLARMLGLDESMGQAAIDAFWEANPATKQVIDKYEAEWKARGKKFITSWTGEPLFVRKQNAILNTVIQNLGNTVAKMSTVLFHIEMKKLGLQDRVRQFFWVHDEIVSYVHKSLFKFHKFDTIEEAKEAQIQLCYSKPFEKQGQIWCAESIVGQKLIESFGKAGKRLGLKIEMTGDFQVGDRYSQCK